MVPQKKNSASLGFVLQLITIQLNTFVLQKYLKKNKNNR